MVTKKNDEIKLCAVGDVVVNREDPKSMWALAAPIIRQSDIAFCQLEAPISEKYGYLQTHAWGPPRSHPRTIEAFSDAGFNVISYASNNAMDWGPDCFLDTIENLRKSGIQVVGAGKNIVEARKPVIIEVKGTRIGFLAYCSIILAGFAAGPNKPGIAPMWAWTVYHQVEHDQPGTPCEILTFADRNDLQAMIEDIKKLRPQVDVLAVSHHWGIHFIPATIAMYQPEVAHAAIDAGADIILGHHPHLLKGIEIYKGKGIFYSMNMFSLDIQPGIAFGSMAEETAKRYGWKIDPEYSLFPFGEEARKTILVRCLIAGKEIQKISFLPALINKQNQPEILTRKSKDFDKVVGYMEEITRNQKLNAKFIVEGDEVVISI